MLRNTKLNRIAIAVAMSMGMATAAFAQETSSGISGTVVTTSGSIVPGAEVTLTDARTGSVKQLVTNEAGIFNTRGLRVGGPYTVKISDDKGQRIIEDVYLSLGEPMNLNVTLESSSDVETITVTGRSVGVASEITGPSSFFGLDELQNQPSVNRDIKDTLALDPRITIDQTNSDAITCGGANNRFNSISVDGVRQNDNFGLNANGYPTERLPFPFDAIDQVKVELAPFDVQYGGFTGCAINAVTRSGTNEIHGSFFYDYTSDSLQGDSIEGDDIDVASYDESRYGFTIGAPLIKDKLFFFGAFEKHKPTQIYSYGASDSGAANPISGITTADLERIASIALNKYGYTVGDINTTSEPEKEEKILLKLDWLINQDHRATLTYQNTDGNTISTTDSGSYGYAFNDHFYTRGNELTTYSAQLFSTWSDKFETEAKIGYLKIKNGQKSLTSDPDFGEIQIDNVGGKDVHFGADEYRQSNILNYDTTSAKLAGTYYLGEHIITGGFEYESTDVFNLFNPGAEGLFVFDTIDDLENGLAKSITYRIPGSLDTNDAAASFTFENSSLYVQDKWTATDDLTLTFGLRYDSWASDDVPGANANFEQRYGFSNAVKPDFSLLQPRFGFNYTYDDTTFVYGGVGLFSGGNPNVWLSNNYSNDGLKILSSSVSRSSSNTAAQTAALDASTTPNFGNEVPDYLVSSLVGGDGPVNALDPDFKTPSIWKFNVGVQKELAYDVLVGADVIYSKQKNSVITTVLNTVKTGELAPDGRPMYANVDLLDADCVADVTSANCSKRADLDYYLTNASDDGESTVISLFANKDFDSGIKIGAGYAYMDATEASPMTSSTASSNYGDYSVVDYNDPDVATSNYEIKHRFTLNFAYKMQLFAGYDTRVNIFAQRVSGKPYSYTFDYDPGFGDGKASEDRSLFYVPLENDPIVQYADGFDLDGLNALIEAQGLTRGQIQDRNEQNSSWWTRVDLKFTQEIPGFMEGHKGMLTFSIKNIGNLLNDDWGVYRQVSYEYNNPIVDAKIQSDGTYLYTNFDGDQGQSIDQDASLWSMRVGVKYTF